MTNVILSQAINQKITYEEDQHQVSSTTMHSILIELFIFFVIIITLLINILINILNNNVAVDGLLDKRSDAKFI